MSVPAVAPRLRTWRVSRQEWTDAAFLHWSVDPDLVAPMLPPGTRPDVFGGRTFVGLIPFRMNGAWPGRTASTRGLHRFPETNVRLYSVDTEGNHGVVFRSLDAASLPLVLGARVALRVPYLWSRLWVSADEDLRVYVTRRRGRRRKVRSVVRLRVGEPIEPTSLDVFLTARWGAHTRVAGRTLWVPNAHEPWPLHAAELESLGDGADDALLRAAGFPDLGTPDVPVRWSPGVHASFGTPRTVHR